MIDTIIISIPKSAVKNAIDPGNVSLGWAQQAQTNYYSKFIKNPSKRDIESGFYFPRLTGINRSINGVIDAFIKVEFSIPKLIYLNNLDEVSENDFDQIINTLKDRLLTMGIFVQEKYLRRAPVTAVHYSKNILLTNGYTSQFVLSELNKIDVRKSFDLTKTRFMNDGESFCIYANSHSFVIYDKIADLKKYLKKSIDKDQTKYQKSLFDSIDKKELYEVLRLEIRISQKRKLNSLFKKLGLKENPTFEDAFKISISKTVVQYYWNTLINNNSGLLFGSFIGPKDILKQIFIANPKLKSKQAVYFAGLISMTKDGNGMRELRSILGKYSDDRTWYRTKEDINYISDLLKRIRPRDWFDQIEKALKDFETFNKNGP